MVQSFAVLENANTLVFQSLTLIMAAAVCNQLEGAGFPARLGEVKDGFAVFVPQEDAAASRNLLTARPRTGEIFGLLGMKEGRNPRVCN